MESKLESGNSSSVKNNHESESRYPKEPLRILMLAANPVDRNRLELTEEYRLLRGMVYPNSEAGACDLHVEWAARAEDLHRALMEFKPHIVHFSGHANDEVICLEDDERKSHALTKMELGLLFNLTRNWLRVVVLNACYSARQVTTLSELVDFVVGTNIPVSDQVALQFTDDFYRAIAKGDTVREAFNKAQKNTPPEAYELVVRPDADETTPLLPPIATIERVLDAKTIEADEFNFAREINEGQNASVDRTASSNEKNSSRIGVGQIKTKKFNFADLILKKAEKE
jgi:hypothetical protein